MSAEMYLSDVEKWHLRNQTVYGIDCQSSLPPAQPLLLGTSQGPRAGRDKWRKIISTQVLTPSNTPTPDKILGFKRPMPKKITGKIIGLVFLVSTVSCSWIHIMLHSSSFHLNEQNDPTASPSIDQEGSIVSECVVNMCLSECKIT